MQHPADASRLYRDASAPHHPREHPGVIHVTHASQEPDETP